MTHRYKWIAGAVAIAIGLVVLYQCQEGTEKKREVDRAAKAVTNAEVALLDDTVRAGPELIKRLHKHIEISNGLLIIRQNEFFQTINVLPITAPWTVECSMFGFAVVIGSDIFTDDVESGIKIELTTTTPTDSQCNNLAPIIGREMMIITQSSNNKSEPPAQ